MPTAETMPTGRLIAVLLLLSVAGAPAQQGPSNLFFMQLADPQFGMYAKNGDFSQESANYDFAIKTANRLRPRFVIVCGDLVNKPGDADQIREYERISAKLDPSIRIYHVAGNHDVGNEPTPNALKAYRERFGPDYYSFREGPIYGIVLNSSLIHSPQNAPGELRKQDLWLEAELERARASGAPHIVVFLHHPIFIERADEPDQYFNIPPVRRAPLLDSLRRAGVKYVFAGHYHRNAHGSDGQLEMVTTGPVGMPLGGARSGLRLVWVTQREIQHEFFDFGALPSRPVPTK